VFVEQRKYIKLLPRDVETPGSILAFVYASKKLQTWARERHEKGQWDDGEGSRLSLAMIKEMVGRTKGKGEADELMEASMGPFDSNEHWGVEIDAAPARISLLSSESQPFFSPKGKSSFSSHVKHESTSTYTTQDHLPHET